MKRRALVMLSVLAAVAVAGTAFIFVLVPGASLLFKAGNNATTSATGAESNGPTLLDGSLSLEEVTGGLKFPTSMAFLDAGNMLVLQKNDGQVRLVSGGRLAERPVLQVNVNSKQEQGLLGIAVWNGSSPTSNEVFLYLSKNATDGHGNTAATNSVYKYRYDWGQKALVNGTLVLKLPGMPGPYHNGGKIAIGPDGYLYAIIGDVTDSGNPLGNEAGGKAPDDRSVIVRVDRETGEAPGDNPFYGIKGLDKVYAYGIRNSFGLAFDPLTGKLWDTENGPDRYDEINVVEPGFNSGWDKLAGPIARSNNVTAGDLVMFKGAHYSDPAFSWYIPIGVTDIQFLHSEKLGEKYRDNVFVGDINNGNLYFFDVDRNRTGLYFSNDGQPELADRVADPAKDEATGRQDGELSSIVLGKNFEGRITDIETGPDGYLYVLTYLDGKIYRITAAGSGAGQQ